MMYYLPPEWHPQDAVMLTWPHEATDWVDHLHEVELTYLVIASEILKRQALIVVCHSSKVEQSVKALLKKNEVDISKLLTYIIPTNDTWARDHGPISLVNSSGAVLCLDYIFNGWGEKFDYRLDNAINRNLIPKAEIKANYKSKKFILEGGSIEVDGEGHLITTQACLLNPNRNPKKNQQKIEQELKSELGIECIFWLKSGHLEGDDTDAHIDTLVRFAPNNTLVYVQCLDPLDTHFTSLKKMEAELQQLRNKNGEPFKLVPLPLPEPCFNSQNERLPATYANFLIINHAVLLPIYNQPKLDEIAIIQVQKAFPKYEIVAIDCTTLINQFGSLHCISMQLPKGFLS